MLLCIYLLRILGAILITNSHYELVYPVAILANGGLLGDVLFFAVSGFCLYPVKKAFPQWYGRRLKRIFPLVWIITVIYLLLGFYQAGSFLGFVKLLVYPTYYHFVASILLLYLVYYFVAMLLQKQDANWNRLFGIVLVILAALYTVLYLTVYDRSFYHIDNVREPMIEFLYFFAMMIGMYFRRHQDRYVGKTSLWSWICAAVLFGMYFVSKLAFAKGILNSRYQPLNQILLLLLLLCLFRGMIGLEDKLARAPEKLRRFIKYLASFTFEIYLVQYMLIPRLNVGPFPLNFLLVSGGIILSALLLHLLHDKLMTGINHLMGKLQSGRELAK